MELREYIKIFSHYRNTVLSLALAGIILPLLWGFIAYRGYEGRLSLIIRPSSLQKSTEFQYNGFYTMETSDRVTRMLEQWLKQKGLPMRLKRLGSQYLEISFVKERESELNKFKDTIEQNVKTFLASLSKFPEESFEAVVIASSQDRQEAPLTSFLIIGLVAGLATGLFAALFRHYLS